MRKFRKILCVIIALITVISCLSFTSFADSDCYVQETDDSAENYPFTEGLIIKHYLPSIKVPSTRKIRYGDTLILYLDTYYYPNNSKVEWTITQGSDAVTIAPSEDGMSCAVTSVGSGDVIVTTYFVGEDGEYVTCEGQKFYGNMDLTSDAGFISKFIDFIKTLFGMSRVIKK